jgi:hypothetical protein
MGKIADTFLSCASDTSTNIFSHCRRLDMASLVHPAALRPPIYLDGILEKLVNECGVHVPRDELMALARTRVQWGLLRWVVPTFQLVAIDLSAEGQFVSRRAFSP